LSSSPRRDALPLASATMPSSMFSHRRRKQNTGATSSSHAQRDEKRNISAAISEATMELYEMTSGCTPSFTQARVAPLAVLRNIWAMGRREVGW
jgi:hypothetical protein